MTDDFASSSARRFALKSRRVVLPGGVRPAVVVVEGRQITGVFDPSSPAVDCPVEDLDEMVIAPGIIDAHVHVNEPGRTEWEGFSTATQAAAAGGVTTLVDMPLNSNPVTTTAVALQVKREAAAGKCWVNVGFYGGLVPGNLDQIESLMDAGVFGIKAFLCPSGLDDFGAATLADVRAAAPLIARRKRPLLVHAELLEAPAPRSMDPRSYASYAASRPEAWEAGAIRQLIDVARTTGCSVHIVHLANAHALPALTDARQEGLPVTVETCPHYLYFSAEQIPDGDTRFKCAPPIRSREHQDLLWHGLGQNLIDTIGSDHSPCPPEMKCLESGNFTTAWGGIASLQLTLPIVWTRARQLDMPLHSLSNWLSANPARLLGIADRKGRIAAGYDADLIVWDPEQSRTVKGESLHHRHKVTPYEGEQLFGEVHRTYLGGALVYREIQFVGGPSGSLLSAAAQPRV